MAYAPREEIIRILKDQGYSSTEINDAIVDAGYNALTSEERKGLPITPQGKPIEAIKGGISKNIKEIAGAFPTVLGLLGRSIADATLAGREETTPQQINALRNLTRGSRYLKPLTDIRNLINIPLGQYNITTERIGNTLTGGEGRRLSLDDMLYGLATNPVFTGMDIVAPLTKGIGSIIGKTTQAGKRAGELAKFNRLLNTAKMGEEVQLMKQDPVLNNIAMQFKALSKKEREAISNAIQKTGATDLGNKGLNKLLKQVKESSHGAAKQMIDKGLIEQAYHDNNILANYIGNNLGWDNLTHKDIMKILETPEKLTGKVKELYDQGRQLLDKGNLAFLTQAVHPAESLGVPVERAENYFKQAREIGTRTPEEMADYIPQALERQNRYANQISGIKELQKLLKGYKTTEKPSVYLSANELDNYLKEAVKEGKNVTSAIKGLPRATKDEIEAGNYIGLPKLEAEALGRYGNPTRSNDLLNIWKRSVLGGSKWFTENRLGNLQANAIEGVGPTHYLKAGASYKNAPKELDALTRAYGYAGNKPTSVTEPIATGLQRMLLGAKGVGVNLADKDLKRALVSASEIPEGLADIVSQPMFNIEAYFDKLDRYANFKKQTERLAKKYKTTPSKIEGLAKKDPEIFSEVYDKVNKSLGDYTSRNYFLPSNIENFRQNVLPFYKFYTNTLGVTGRQLANHPFRSQLFLTGPAKYGRDINYDLKNQGIIPEEYNEGGYPSGNVGNYGETQLIRSEGIPLGAIAQIASSATDIGSKGPEEITNLTSPIFGLKNMLELKGAFGKTLTSPKWEAGDKMMYARDPETGMVIPEEYKMSGPEYAQTIGTQLLKQGYSPVVHERDFRAAMKGLVDPVYKAATTDSTLGQALQEATMYPMYDTSLNPLEEGNVSKYPARGPMDILGRLIGFRLTEPYVNQGNINKQDFRRTLKKSIRKD